MIYFLRQEHNPDKHWAMPGEYPWQVQEVEPTDGRPWESVSTQEELNTILSSISLALYGDALLREKLALRQKRRDEVKGALVQFFGADNLFRIYKGVWTSAQLKSLDQDPTMQEISRHIYNLSFELALEKVELLNHEIITPEIKQEMRDTIYANLFME
jgi:hypothetical protein